MKWLSLKVLIVFIALSHWSHAIEMLGLDSHQVRRMWSKEGSGPFWIPTDQRIPQIPARLDFQKKRLKQIQFEAPRSLTNTDLWALLDWVGENSAWMEMDLKAHLEPRFKPWIKDAKQIWFFESPAHGGMVAVLKSRGLSATLTFRLLEPQIKSEPLIPLECQFKGDMRPFDDFILQGTGLCALDEKESCILVHRDDQRLRAIIQGKTLRMQFHSTDLEPLPMVQDFSSLDASRKVEMVRDYLSYFNHERSMAVRAFFESAPGIFNWQPWYWVRKDVPGTMTLQTIEALLMSAQVPSEIVLMDTKCRDGRSVRLLSDGQGTLQMTLR